MAWKTYAASLAPAFPVRAARKRQKQSPSPCSVKTEAASGRLFCWDDVQDPGDRIPHGIDGVGEGNVGAWETIDGIGQTTNGVGNVIDDVE